MCCMCDRVHVVCVTVSDVCVTECMCVLQGRRSRGGRGGSSPPTFSAPSCGSAMRASTKAYLGSLLLDCSTLCLGQSR